MAIWEELTMKLNYVTYSLYSLAGLEMIIGLILRMYLLVIVCASFTLIATLFRAASFIRFKKKIQKKMDWKDVRTLLYDLLTEKKILESDIKTATLPKEVPLIDSLKDVKDATLLESQDLIIKIRNIGLDGILCLIFLMQQEPAITSVRVLNRILKIPIATLYRNLQKIQENELVTCHYVTDQPEKAFYRITDEGISLIIQLYEILGGDISLPGSDSIRGSVATETT